MLFNNIKYLWNKNRPSFRCFEYLVLGPTQSLINSFAISIVFIQQHNIQPFRRFLKRNCEMMPYTRFTENKGKTIILKQSCNPEESQQSQKNARNFNNLFSLIVTDFPFPTILAGAKEIKSRKRPQIKRFSLNQGNDGLRSSLVLCYFFSAKTF